MKCKPGDTVLIIGGNPKYLGWMAEVVDVAQRTIFTLPNGMKHKGCGPERWVINGLGGQFTASDGVLSQYAVAPDKILMPINPIPDDVQVSDSISA